MTTQQSTLRLGVAFTPDVAPERLRSLVTAAENAGLDDFWVWEDCFKQSGVAAAGAALAWTERIRVGIGLLPVPLRNVALTAMEIATLDRMFPGRLLTGVGHGVQSWMGQAGVRAASPLTLLREYTVALRQLLAGAEVTTSGRYVTLDGVRLDWPPEGQVPLFLGGAGPKALALAGELGDGTLLGNGLDRDEIAAACRTAIGPDPDRTHPVVVTVIAATGDHAEERLARELGRWGATSGHGVGAAGSADTIAAHLRSLPEVGITTVVVQPTQDEPDLEAFVRFLGTEVRPLLQP